MPAPPAAIHSARAGRTRAGSAEHRRRAGRHLRRGDLRRGPATSPRATTGTGGPTAGGYAGWYRLSGLGGTVDEIIAVDSGDGPMQITILASDKAVKFTGSGQWVQVS